MNLNATLTDLIAQTSLQVSEQQIEKLVQYVLLLDKWNKAYNLTSVRDPQDMLVKHIMDSLMVGEHLNGNHFIDVGTGPGLPGIPLSILYPDRNFVLLDSLGKRVTFLRQVVYQLKLSNVTPVKSRVEEFSPEKPFDGVLSRAFASLQDMVQWCHHLVSPTHGVFYALKGVYPEEEITQLPASISLVDSNEIKVPGLTGERHVLTLKRND
ncbi:16S rRNA (guanine(527)-N(7))-methyltransferase RsmG [Thalassotalea agarivorans]|uniref:Ribosomal RNA small subunit methyltransferase G n=1 Tax=Thalassotalea agarivorans TaxID=349064 RepID=A0A1I0GC41_THASX|nr:16S rRNA (guanine(527)-N(7))-methyltransferase RsmG [Thalassotalea agarivorans]SET68465.1 16S rRNA m(7)G-527 methyltransferase [Thalassotalea agarivorans]